MSPHVPMIGKGIRKVSWRSGRSFGLWHAIKTRRGDDIVTGCGASVPPNQNVRRCYTDSAMPLPDVCQREGCFPPPMDEPVAA